MNANRCLSVNKNLVFWKCLSENYYTLYLSWFCSFQLELARTNYINRTIETFERFLLIKKTLVKSERRKIVFVKVESNVTRNIWKRHTYNILKSWCNAIILINSYITLQIKVDKCSNYTFCQNTTSSFVK